MRGSFAPNATLATVLVMLTNRLSTARNVTTRWMCLNMTIVDNEYGNCWAGRLCAQLRREARPFAAFLHGRWTVSTRGAYTKVIPMRTRLYVHRIGLTGHGVLSGPKPLAVSEASGIDLRDRCSKSSLGNEQKPDLRHSK